MKSKPYRWRIEDPNDVAALEIEACDEGGGPYLVLRTDGDFGLCSFEEIDALAADLRKMLSDAGAKEDAPSTEAERDELAQIKAERDELRAWRDEASLHCVNRQCSTVDRRLQEAESERDALEEQCDIYKARLDEIRDEIRDEIGGDSDEPTHTLAVRAIRGLRQSLTTLRLFPQPKQKPAGSLAMCDAMKARDELKKVEAERDELRAKLQKLRDEFAAYAKMASDQVADALTPAQQSAIDGRARWRCQSDVENHKSKQAEGGATVSPEEPMDPDLAVWDCKIGWEDRRLLPPGCDGPMRQAVRRAFVELVGKEPDFIFSGWGGSLTEYELAVVEKRKRKQAGGGAS